LKVFFEVLVLDMFFEGLKLKKVVILRGSNPEQMMTLQCFLRFLHFHELSVFIDFSLIWGSSLAPFWEGFGAWGRLGGHLGAILEPFWVILGHRFFH